MDWTGRMDGFGAPILAGQVWGQVDGSEEIGETGEDRGGRGVARDWVQPGRWKFRGHV
jgi:hypothetical protein